LLADRQFYLTIKPSIETLLAVDLDDTAQDPFVMDAANRSATYLEKAARRANLQGSAEEIRVARKGKFSDEVGEGLQVLVWGETTHAWLGAGASDLPGGDGHGAWPGELGNGNGGTERTPSPAAEENPLSAAA